jgi:hypothetical protein
MRLTIPIVAILLCATATSQAVVIDDFSVGPTLLVRNASVAVAQIQTGLDPNHVLGGQRDILLGQFYENPQTFEIDTTRSQMTLTHGGPGKLAGVDIYYGSSTNPLEVDLTAGGHDRFILDFGSIGPGPSWMRVASLSGTTLTENTVSISRFFDGNISTIPYTEFGSLDFTNIARIKLEFFRSGGVVLESFYTIPEPTSASMMSVFATAPILLRRRWR